MPINLHLHMHPMHCIRPGHPSSLPIGQQPTTSGLCIHTHPPPTCSLWVGVLAGTKYAAAHSDVGATHLNGMLEVTRHAYVVGRGVEEGGEVMRMPHSEWTEKHQAPHDE